MPKVKEKITLNSAGRDISKLISVSICALLFCLIFPPFVDSLHAADNNKIALENQFSSPIPEGLNDAEAKRLVSDWLHLSEDDGKLEALMALYAETVSYYKQKNADQSFIREDKMKYYKRWPLRKYTLESADVLADTDYYTKTVVVNYHFDLQNKEKTLQGEAESFLWLDKKNNRIFIILETGHVIATADNKAGSEKKKASQEHKKTSPAKWPRTVIMDSQTGFTVFPDEIEIMDPNNHKVLYHQFFTKEESISQFKDGLITTFFLASIPVPPDRYDCRVTTANYKPRISSCWVGSKLKEDTPKKNRRQIERYNTNLDPIEKPPEFKADFVKTLEQKDSSVLFGFISDDDSGLPLENVCIGTADGKISTRSDEHGLFILRISLPDDYEHYSEEMTTDVVFEKEDYRTEEWDYFVLLPNEVAMTRLRLVPGHGRKIIDERKHRRWGQVPDREIIRKPCR